MRPVSYWLRSRKSRKNQQGLAENRNLEADFYPKLPADASYSRYLLQLAQCNSQLPFAVDDKIRRFIRYSKSCLRENKAPLRPQARFIVELGMFLLYFQTRT